MVTIAKFEVAVDEDFLLQLMNKKTGKEIRNYKEFKREAIKEIENVLKDYGVRAICVADEYVSKKEKKQNYAGRLIKNPYILKTGFYVSLREKGSFDARKNSSFWEHGELVKRKDNSMFISTYDQTYDLDDNKWEIYEDTRYKRYNKE